MLIAQITDCHIVEAGHTMADRIDPAPSLQHAVDAINALDTPPDLVLATGDLVNDGTSEQYERLAALLAPLAMPMWPIPGNHDDRTLLRRTFPQLPPGGADDRIDYVVDAGDLVLIGLDTAIPGRNDGHVTDDQMAWLDLQLAGCAGRPTIVFQHHPPFESGIPWMDGECGFTGGELEANVLRRHHHVEAVVCGHLHRTMHRRFAGTVASTWPSTAVQLVLGFADELPGYTDEPSGFALHHLGPSGCNSHLVPVVAADRWVPSWASG